MCIVWRQSKVELIIYTICVHVSFHLFPTSIYLSVCLCMRYTFPSARRSLWSQDHAGLGTRTWQCDITEFVHSRCCNFTCVTGPTCQHFLHLFRKEISGKMRLLLAQAAKRSQREPPMEWPVQARWLRQSISEIEKFLLESLLDG